MLQKQTNCAPFRPVCISRARGVQGQWRGSGCRAVTAWRGSGRRPDSRPLRGRAHVVGSTSDLRIANWEVGLTLRDSAGSDDIGECGRARPRLSKSADRSSVARQIPEVSSLLRCVVTNFFRRGAKSSARSTNAAYSTGPIRSADRVVGSGQPPSGTDVMGPGPDGGPD